MLQYVVRAELFSVKCEVRTDTFLVMRKGVSTFLATIKEGDNDFLKMGAGLLFEV